MTNTQTHGPIKTPIPDLHSIGPFLSLYSHNVQTFFELDGTGQRLQHLPEGYYDFSPDMRWNAYITGKFDPTGPLPEGGVVLHVFDIQNGLTRDVAKIIPEDYLDRQKILLREAKSKYPSSSGSGTIYDFNIESVFRSLIVGLNNIIWSPDERFMAFPAIIDGNSSDIYIYDIDTNRISRVDYGIFNVFNMQWSPDGQQLIVWDSLPVNGDFLQLSVRIIHLNNLSSMLLSDFSMDNCCLMEWISKTEFLQMYVTDGGVGYNLRVTNAFTGATSMIWENASYGDALDLKNNWILLSGSPCKNETCPSGGPGFYIGPIHGPLRRIADGKSSFIAFRGGKFHKFITMDGALKGLNSNNEFDLLPNHGDRFSISQDFRWLVTYGRDGLTLFDESDQVVFDRDDIPVYDVTWKTNSQGLYLMTDEKVYFLSTEQPELQMVFECPPWMCKENESMTLAPEVYLTSLPFLRIHPPSFDLQTQGTSFWSRSAFKDLLKPGINEYTVKIPAYSEWRWDFSWCAKDQTGLGKILAPLDIGFYIGGEKIGEDIFRMYDSANSSGFCRTWATLLSGWQPGDKTDLEIRYTLRESINDGTREYPDGEYRQIIHVLVQ